MGVIFVVFVRSVFVAVVLVYVELVSLFVFCIRIVSIVERVRVGMVLIVGLVEVGFVLMGVFCEVVLVLVRRVVSSGWLGGVVLGFVLGVCYVQYAIVIAVNILDVIWVLVICFFFI